jgi:hypothetical protein
MNTTTKTQAQADRELAKLEKAFEYLAGRSVAELEQVVLVTAGEGAHRAKYQVATALLGRGHIPSLSL